MANEGIVTHFLLLQKLTYKKAKQVPQNYKLFTNIGIKKTRRIGMLNT